MITKSNDTEHILFIKGMNDCVDRVLDEVEPAETVRFFGLTLSGLLVHRTRDIKDTDDSDIVSFELEFRRGDFDIGHEFASVKRGDCFDREILVIDHGIFVGYINAKRGI